jgi:hypothetical protein
MSRQMQAKSTIRGVASGAVAYRGSREGPRDIVFVPMWSKNCELMPELPSMQGWVDAVSNRTPVPGVNCVDCSTSTPQACST